MPATSHCCPSGGEQTGGKAGGASSGPGMAAPAAAAAAPCGISGGGRGSAFAGITGAGSGAGAGIGAAGPGRTRNVREASRRIWAGPTASRAGAGGFASLPASGAGAAPSNTSMTRRSPTRKTWAWVPAAMRRESLPLPPSIPSTRRPVCDDSATCPMASNCNVKVEPDCWLEKRLVEGSAITTRSYVSCTPKRGVTAGAFCAFAG